MVEHVRWWPGILVAIGCVRPPAQPPATEPAEAIDGELYEGRLSGLRATLARHGVAIDTDPVIETCAPGRHDERCVRCEVANRSNIAGVDPSLIDAIAIAFAAYPPKLIAAAQLEHVALCRSIELLGEGDRRAPAGVAIADQHRLLISVEYFVDGAPSAEHFGIMQVVHHEVFHLFDQARESSDREWEAINPPGFAYQDPASDAVARPAGFVNGYATTNAREDRASVFEYLLGQPARLCEIAHADRVVAAKTRLVWKRVARVVGDKLLRQHAPCVDAIGKKPRKVAPRAVKLRLR